jgi:DNA-binding FadR family transcriptional regulator
VADFYELFAASEAVITRFAALRRSPEQADAFRRLIDELQDKSARLRGAATASAALRMLNRVRHEALHKLAGSPIAADLVAGMWDRSDFYIRLAFGSFVVNAAVRRAQQQIADAVIAGDARTAEKQTRDYLCAVGKAAAGQMRKALRR